MKAIALLTLVFLMLAATCVACLALVGVYESDEALRFLLKLSSIILVLGVASFLIALLTSRRDKNQS